MDNKKDRKYGSYEFKKIDTKEKAYVMGYYTGKGRIESENRIFCYIPYRDRNIAVFISDTIEANINFHRRRKAGAMYVIKKNTKDGKQFLGDEREGSEKLPIVNKSLLKYELQGIYDAIGSVAWGHRKDNQEKFWQRINFLSKSVNILTCLQQVLFKELNISSTIRPKANSKVIYVLEFKNSHDVYKFIRFIYDDNDMIVSKRRYSKFKALRLELEEFGETLED